MSSVIEIFYDGTDITSNVVFADTHFQMESNAIPGTFDMRITGWAGDPFVTGRTIQCVVDGVPLYSGFLTQVSSVFAFEVVDTITPASLTDIVTDQFVLRGVDLNVLLDKRVIRNTGDYLHSLPIIPGSTLDGDALADVLATYVDDFGISGTIGSPANVIENITTVSGDGSSDFSFGEQGQQLREIFKILTLRSGAVYYIHADGSVHFQALESVEAPWGFSDIPDGVSSIGFREIEAVEDGSLMVNDALIWGGSEWAGSGTTVFSRVEDSTSEADHNRWQLAELHFGETGFLIQDGVDARANAIVLGPPGADALGQEKGLRYSQWEIQLTWFAHDVPSSAHLVCGDLVTIELNVFGITKLLPLRRLEISFPDNAADGTSYVQFVGTFNLNQSDPFTIWKYILSREKRVTNFVSSSVDDSSTSTIYGATGHFTPTPDPDDVETVFSIPFGYIPGTLELYQDIGSGLKLLRLTIDYTETSPVDGTFTMTSAPSTGDTLWVICRTLGV